MCPLERLFSKLTSLSSYGSSLDLGKVLFFLPSRSERADVVSEGSHESNERVLEPKKVENRCCRNMRGDYPPSVGSLPRCKVPAAALRPKGNFHQTPESLRGVSVFKYRWGKGEGRHTVPPGIAALSQASHLLCRVHPVVQQQQQCEHALVDFPPHAPDKLFVPVPS